MTDKMISLSDLYQISQKLPSGEVILDVRSPSEWVEGHIPGSLNIPHDFVEDHVEELKNYKKIYIHCKMGGRAKKAFETLQENGLKNLYCLEDAGMQAWLDEGYPTETEG